MKVPVLNTILLNNPNVSPTGAGECSITLSAAAIGNGRADPQGAAYPGQYSGRDKERVGLRFFCCFIGSRREFGSGYDSGDYGGSQ